MDSPELAAHLTENETAPRATAMRRRVSLDVEFEGSVYTLDVELTDDEVAQAQSGKLPDRVIPILQARSLGAMWDRIHEADAANARKWSRVLRRRGVEQLERKMRDPNYNPTPVEDQQWRAAVHLSKVPLQAEAEWDRWYEQPVAVSLFGPERKPASASRPVRRSQPRRTVGRRLARTGSGPPGRKRQSDDPDEPPPVNHAAALDARLDVRERLVCTLDELDADDPSSARFVLEGLLADLDAEMDGRL